MKTNNKPEIHYHITFNGPVGQHIDHIERQYVCFDKDMKMQTFSVDDTEAIPSPKINDNPIIEKLIPIFLQNEEAAKEFLEVAVGSDSTTITDLVNEYLAKKKISRTGCKRKLWKILHDAEIYPRGESNWNKMLNV